MLHFDANSVISRFEKQVSFVDKVWTHAALLSHVAQEFDRAWQGGYFSFLPQNNKRKTCINSLGSLIQVGQMK
jgi:hypothetical protein